MAAGLTEGLRQPARTRDAATRVTILGGGSAGLLAALALRALRPELELTLLASSRLPVIGVGEATTPLLPQFLHADLGLDIHRLWHEVRPTLKLGIRFAWGERDFNYPFGPLRLVEPWRYDGDTDAASLRSLLMSARRLPIFDPSDESSGESPSARFGTAVAYHLDNRRFVAYLAGRAAEAGVEPVDATIAEVRLDERGERVEELVAEDGRRFRADLWIDCSGFRSRLLGDALASPWIPFRDSLVTDRALVASAPADREPASHTHAATWDAGWCWSIPQRDDDGTAVVHHGYVYSSAHVGAEAAAGELARRLPQATPGATLRFRAGRHRHFVRGNVAALGNAYGFVEPLESTSLHLLVRQIGLLARLIPWLPEESAGRLRLANRKVGDWWDYLRWFLALHFRCNRRLDTPFWRDCRQSTDVSAWEELLTVFRQRGPLSADPSMAALLTPPDPLWGAAGIDLLLLAQGVTAGAAEPRASRDEYEAWRRAAGHLVERAWNSERGLGALDTDAGLRDALARGFLAAGPAFP